MVGRQVEQTYGGVVRPRVPGSHDRYVGLYKGGTPETYDAKLVGPGGWFTLEANATYSQAHFIGRQASRAADLPYVDRTDECWRGLE